MSTKIYTRTGDRGETGLWGGARVSKSDPHVEACGSVDEANAAIGFAIASVRSPILRGRLSSLQPDLFALGSHLATLSRPGRRNPALPVLPEDRILEMERWIDEMEEELPKLKKFIMPGGSLGGAALHLARVAVRRAERAVVALLLDGENTGENTGEKDGEKDGEKSAEENEHVDAEESEDVPLRYLNRLSDLLFVMARTANHTQGVFESQWLPEMKPAVDTPA